MLRLARAAADASLRDAQEQADLTLDAIGVNREREAETERRSNGFQVPPAPAPSRPLQRVRSVIGAPDPLAESAARSVGVRCGVGAAAEADLVAEVALVVERHRRPAAVADRPPPAALDPERCGLFASGITTHSLALPLRS